MRERTMAIKRESETNWQRKSCLDTQRERHRHTNLEIDAETHRERESAGTCLKQQVRDGRARHQARGVQGETETEDEI